MNKGLKEKILQLRLQGKNYNQIVLELGCTKSVVSYHCTNNKLGRPGEFTPVTKEEIQELKELYDSGKTCVEVAIETGWSKTTVQKLIEEKRKRPKLLTASQSVVSWRKRTKRLLVEYKGGKCEKCEYNKTIEALQFHHRDPQQKDFNISGKSWSLARLREEVDKCNLLCANCHAEEHILLVGETGITADC